MKFSTMDKGWFTRICQDHVGKGLWKKICTEEINFKVASNGGLATGEELVSG